MYENIAGLFVQWIKLVQGASLFIIPYRLITAWKGNRIIRRISSLSYEIYLVHEFFVHEMITNYYPGETWLKIIIAWGLIAIATWMLVMLSKVKRSRGIEQSSISR